MEKEDDDNYDLLSENNNNIINSMTEKRKRRSKHDAEGRRFRCPECGKSYLSMPALTNHRKGKHDYGKFGERKGRGRPRKEPLIINPIDSTEKKFKNFFEKDFRRQINGERVEYDHLRHLLENTFDLYKNNLSFEHGKTEGFHKYPFFVFLLENWDISVPEFNQVAYDFNEKLAIKNPKTIDIVLYSYLKECSVKTSKEYFEFIINFVVLFREGLNLIMKKEDEENNSKAMTMSCYTERYNAQEVPEMCNDVIEKFFEQNYFFGLDAKDLAEIIQHICFWMYINNYTSSRLTIG